MTRILYFLLLAYVLTGCNNRSDSNIAAAIPAEPDYEDASLWYTNDKGDSIDVFYVTPTCIFDWKDSLSGTTYHHYNVYGGPMKENFDYSLQLAEDIFAQNSNFYAPYYRQISLESWTESEEKIEGRFATAMHDIRSAFKYYMKHINKGKKFVLAGYSQGAKAVVELVKQLDNEELSRMKAAYVIGYRVDDEDLKSTNIKAASGETDTGVIICYNSVHTPQDMWNVVSMGNRISINPVNWHTDGTPAKLNDTITVKIDEESRLLLVDGYDGGGLEIPTLKGVITSGNYHLSELTLFKENLKNNVYKRTR